MANKILHTTIMQKNVNGDRLVIYPKTVTKNIIDGSSTLEQTLNKLKSDDVSNKTTEFTEVDTRQNLVSGETLATSHGKIMKLISDLKSLAYTDTVGVSNLDSTLATAYNNRITTDNVTVSTSITSAGYVADARAVNNLQNQINTVNTNINTRFPNNGITFDVTTQSTSNHLLYSIDDENWCGFGCEPDGSFTIRVGTWNEGKHVFKVWTNGSFTFDDKPIATTKNLQDLIVRKRLDFEEISLNVGETIVPYDLTPIIDGYNLVTVLHPVIAYINSYVPARVTFTQYYNVSGDMRIYSDTQVKIRLFLEVLLTKK